MTVYIYFDIDFSKLSKTPKLSKNDQTICKTILFKSTSQEHLRLYMYFVSYHLKMNSLSFFNFYQKSQWKDGD